MRAFKLDLKTKKCSTYTPPPLASCYETDMERVIQCASCGRPLEYGKGYTSRQIHTRLGFGYIVCGDCYKKEWQGAEAADQEEVQNAKA